jgi:hypothetical protein
MAFCQESDTPRALGDHFECYFEHLHLKKGYKSTSIWSLFSRLNHCYKERFGGKLQVAYPGITNKLKGFSDIEAKEREALAPKADKLPAPPKDPADTIVPKSKQVYEKSWVEFLQHCDLDDNVIVKTDKTILEKHFLSYFEDLHVKRGNKASTIWSVFSRLNYCYQLRFGEKLQVDYPHLSKALKKYNIGYTKKVVNVFTDSQMFEFILRNHGEPQTFWLLRKAFAAIGFSGGLRVRDLRSLRLGCLRDSEEGVWITYQPCRPGSLPESFLVHANLANPPGCHANAVRAYVGALNRCLPDLNADSDLFKTCVKTGFSMQPMGVNYLYKVPQAIAAQLGLPNPTTYTGVAFIQKYGGKDPSTFDDYMQEMENEQIPPITSSPSFDPLQISSTSAFYASPGETRPLLTTTSKRSKLNRFILPLPPPPPLPPQSIDPLQLPSTSTFEVKQEPLL